MNDPAFDGSFKIYVDVHEDQGSASSGNNPPGNQQYSFSQEVGNVKQDVENVEKLYHSLQQSNEDIKIAQNAKTMRELRVRVSMDLHDLLKLAKQINKKFDALVRANAALRGSLSSGDDCDDESRAAMISAVGESLNHMMRKFQGLRAQTETEHRQLIESRYFAITQERATAEAIDNLIANQAVDSPLHHAMQEHGRCPVLDTVAEIQERRDTMMEIRKNLMLLHQIFLGIATPVVVEASPQAQATSAGGAASKGGPPSPMEANCNNPGLGAGAGATAAGPALVVLPSGVAAKGGTGSLNDFERETRRQAYVAIAVTIVIVIVVIVATLKVENQYYDSNYKAPKV